MKRRDLMGCALTAAVLAPVAAQAAPSSDAPVATYVNLQSLNASIVRPDGRRGIMTVELGVDVADAALRARVIQSGPRLRSAMSQVVQRTGAGLRPGYPPDVEHMRLDLQAAVNEALGQRGARVLLGTVMVV